MFSKINIILALTLLMALLFPVSEIFLLNSFSLLFILPYGLFSIVVFIKYEKIYNSDISKSILVLFVLGNILAIDYFFRFGLIDIPFSIKLSISSFTLAILSKSYSEHQIIGVLAEVFLLISMFIYVFQRTKKETIALDQAN
jgi:hypothetical protein